MAPLGRLDRCKHIRSHEMFYADQMNQSDLFHSGIFWCNVTHNGTGPDGQECCIEECLAGRECFQD